ncbi:hypothetical protein JMUB7515_28000 [Staphylococcus aureus]
MDYQTRRNMQTTYDIGVKTKTLTIDETQTFFDLFHMAEEKHGFKFRELPYLSLIHISEPTRLRCISYAVFCLKKTPVSYTHLTLPTICSV